MKKISKIFVLAVLAMICAANVAFAVPGKVDEDNPRQTVQATAKPKATETVKTTTKPTDKPNSTEKATATPKSSTKPSAKPTATTKASPKTTENPDEDKIVLDADDDAIVLDPTAEPTINIQNGSEKLENKKYLTKFGAFLWFLFTVIVSAVISFAISYRFYMMGKKDNHILAEIRALKRDLDSKMVGTVGGFAEYDVSVTNGNRSFAAENSSIHSSATESGEDTDSEIYKKWESKLGTSTGHQRSEKITNPNTNTRVSYSSGRRRPVKTNKSVGGKIKKAISEFFPFDK